MKLKNGKNQVTVFPTLDFFVDLGFYFAQVHNDNPTTVDFG